jgi:hypothetical protein
MSGTDPVPAALLSGSAGFALLGAVAALLAPLSAAGAGLVAATVAGGAGATAAGAAGAAGSVATICSAGGDAPWFCK